MPRFLIVTGILLAVVATFELLVGLEEIKPVTQAIKLDKATTSVPRIAVRQAYPHEIDPAAYAATHLAPAAVIAGTGLQADEARNSPSQTLSSASLDIAREEIDPSLVLLSPYEMTLAVQTELKRLSCYDAKIDGVWGSKSRAAVRQFNERNDSAFHLNESVELLTALKGAPDRLCNDECSNPGNACEIVASADDNMEIPAQIGPQAEKEELPSYLPPWMRDKELAAADDASETEVSETYSATQTSVRRRVNLKPRPSRRRTVHRRARRKKSWLPKSWPGMD